MAINEFRWNLENKKALVTGGTRGIGLAMVKEFLNLGAHVFVVAKNEGPLVKTVADFKAQGYPIQGMAIDLNEGEPACQAIMATLRKTWDRLDILVNNAGTNIRKPAEAYDLLEYQSILQVNLTSAFQLCQMAYPLLKKSSQGAIVNIASVSGLLDDASGAPYGMSKAGLIQLSKHLAVEWANDGIRVNAIAPWYIETELVQSSLTHPALLHSILAQIPLRRVGQPEEVAALAAFLCMPAASYITGQCVAIEGGFLAKGWAKP